jgi:hypothetical protein
MENKDDALELLDLMIEEADMSPDNSIVYGLVRVLRRVRKRVEDGEDQGEEGET